MLGSKKKVGQKILVGKKKSVKSEKYRKNINHIAKFQPVFTNFCLPVKYPISILCHYYHRYVRSKERAEKKDIMTVSANEEKPWKEKPCIICNKIKMKGNVKRYRICEIKRAKQLISAMRFFKDVLYIFDIFAADIKYHSNFRSNYLLKFKRQVELIVNDEHDFTKNEDIDKMFPDILEQIDLKYQTIHVSTVRDWLNEKFHAENIVMLTYPET